MEGSKEGNIIACQCLEKMPHCHLLFHQETQVTPLWPRNPKRKSPLHEDRGDSDCGSHKCLWPQGEHPFWCWMETRQKAKIEVWLMKCGEASHASTAACEQNITVQFCPAKRRIPGLWEGSNCSCQELMLSVTPPPAASPGLRLQSQTLLLQSQLK